MSQDRYRLIIVAAGLSMRFSQKAGNIPKQYYPIHQRPMLTYSVGACLAHPAITNVHIILAAHDHYYEQYTWPWQNDPRVSHHKLGGLTRQESVYNAVIALRSSVQEQDWILVHDAARPLLSIQELSRLIRAATPHATGGILALPVHETVKKSQGTATIIDKTCGHRDLWLALTPQIFRYGLLAKALAFVAGELISDEAAAVERYCDAQHIAHNIQLVRGSHQNIKITEFEDLEFAEWLLCSARDYQET